MGFTGCGKTHSGGRPGIHPNTTGPGGAIAAEKLIRAVGRGFIPGIKPTESTRASAPEACFPGNSLACPPFPQSLYTTVVDRKTRREQGVLTPWKTAESGAFRP